MRPVPWKDWSKQPDLNVIGREQCLRAMLSGMRYLILLTFLALPLHAQEGVRSTDQLLDQAAMSDALTGQVIEFFDG